jgi:LytS/YehU family sensor histidine kinase
VDLLSGYVTVSTKVRREVAERARELGINISELLRARLEEEVRRRELELISRRLDALKDVLDAIDIGRVVRHIREDREGR